MKIRESLRIRESANCAERSVTEKRGGGNALVGEHGETDREESLVDESVVDVSVGEAG